jgi:methylated-DNA-[protein]-cysteine S-methyltransferase
MTNIQAASLHATTCDTPLGRLWLAASADGLAGAWFHGQRHFAGPQPSWRDGADDRVLRDAAAQIQAYFAGRLRRFDLPLAPHGTPFQRAVWRAIAQVPYAGCISYSELARAAGVPAAVRAAGAATGRNPVSIVVPCHRIVGARGALTGYAGGLDRKRTLLALEAGAQVQAQAARGVPHGGLQRASRDVSQGTSQGTSQGASQGALWPATLAPEA